MMGGPRFGVVLAITFATHARASDGFATTVRPIVERYCFECHAGASSKAEVDLARFATERAARAEPHLWIEVERRLKSSEMPPLEHPQPSSAEREVVASWIDHAMRRDVPKDPGRTPPRRLSRSEWSNTIRDVFLVEDRWSRHFPADGSGGAGFDNTADTLFTPPLLLEKLLDAASGVAESVAEPVLLAPLSGDVGFDRADAARVIAHFATLSFRRPPRGDELARLLAERDRAAASGLGFADSIRAAIRAMLVAPSFLFRIERDRPGERSWRIDDLDLATRLAAFLWSSAPDSRLLELALARRLTDPATLRSETLRLLDDPRSIALADDFAAQWLGVRRLLTAADPDRNRFPCYTNSLRSSMIDEARLFFDAIQREDRGLDELVAASFTFLNEELAKHYGVAGVRGEAMRRVILTTPQRGGVVTLGAVLTVTSYPLRTSPVNRGRFVLDELLGDPPPPPPPAVPFLPADEKQDDGLSPRQRLEVHRKDPQCASCHARMDPLGFALENYDGVGRWRDELFGVPIDATAELPGGARFDGAIGLRDYLGSTGRAKFARAFVERLLAYALARGLEPTDAETIDAIVERAGEPEAGLRDVVLAIVESFPFQWRGDSVIDEGP